MRRHVIQVATFAVMSGLLAVAAPPSRAEPTPVIVPVVVSTMPHDPGAYSEGLEFDGPALYESTGEFGKSELRQVDPVTGGVIRSVALPPTFWGEGIAVVGGSIWQLTYQNGLAIEWDKATFTQLRQVPIEGQGWGLCRDGGRFVRSDGSDRLRFHDKASFAEVGSIGVTLDGRPVSGLNELECVDGQVWAAAWPDDRLVRIDPATGVVNLVADVSKLWDSGERNRKRQVVSGIAHIAGAEYLISGKNWPRSYRVIMESVQ